MDFMQIKDDLIRAQLAAFLCTCFMQVLLLVAGCVIALFNVLMILLVIFKSKAAPS
jgi:hypothetical protein